MTDELEKVIHENFNSCRGRGGVSPKALAEVIESSDWLRKVKADAWDEGYEHGSGDEAYYARGLPGDPGADEVPHENPYL